MNYKNILVEIESTIAIITINRPNKLNALNRDTIKELHQALRLKNCTRHSQSWKRTKKYWQ